MNSRLICRIVGGLTFIEHHGDGADPIEMAIIHFRENAARLQHFCCIDQPTTAADDRCVRSTKPFDAPVYDSCACRKLNPGVLVVESA